VKPKAAEKFAHAFGDAGGTVVGVAPGRVNLIGEHTDYNDGYVLPMTIDRSIEAVVRPREDRQVRLVASDFGRRVEFELGQTPKNARRSWVPYVFGIVHELHLRGLVNRGVDLSVSGNVPRGAGLSSSAALETAVAMGLQAAFGFEMNAIEMAMLCREVEHHYAGVHCGVMDQLVSRLGRAGHALLIDCRTVDCRHVPLDLADHRVVIVDSGVRRRLVASDYNLRREECAEAVTHLEGIDPTIRSLRDLATPGLEAHADALPDTLLRRCRHVVGENERVLEACRLLELGDLSSFGALMYAAHVSLRDDFEVSHPTIDSLVDTAMETPGVLGSRLTGAGFGGCTVNLVHQSAVPALSARVKACVDEKGGDGSVIVVERMVEAGVR
jgi:galactokinase